MVTIKKVFIVLAAFSLTVPGRPQSIKDNSRVHTLVVFFDGLRPDYITPQAMPNLYAFSKSGCYCKQHHSVYPTVTRVNASSFSTGSYPATSGLMGNTIYFPQIDKTKGLNTGEAAELNRVSAATGGHLLTSITLGEILARTGQKMMVFSSGSTGSALLQNHTLSGGIIINPEMILPAAFKDELIKEIGPVPPNGKTKDAQVVWVTDAVLRYALATDGPLISTVWFTDPDHTAHGDGIGAAGSMASIKVADQQFGRIIKAIQSNELADRFNIIVTADHGFVTHIGKNSVAEFLVNQGLKKDKASEDVVIAEGAIYVQNHDAARIKSIVSALQSQDWIGSIFTKAKTPNSTVGWVDGTVSFDAIHWNHPERTADILVDYNWNDDKNSFGYAGTSFSRGVAGHGSFSPYEVHIPLLASGPAFKKTFTSELPTSNIDIVPTLLHLHHLAISASMNGRVMHELLAEKNPSAKTVLKKQTITVKAVFPGGIYQLSLQRTVLGKYSYCDFSKVTRTRPEVPTKSNLRQD